MVQPSYDSCEEQLFIFDTVSNKHVTILQAALLEKCANTHLPEIMEVFGKDNLLKFLDIFSGCTIKCPTRDTIDAAVREVFTYVKIESTPEPDRPKVIRDLAVRFDLTPQAVRATYTRVEERMKRYQIEKQKLN